MLMSALQSRKVRHTLAKHLFGQNFPKHNFEHKLKNEKDYILFEALTWNPLLTRYFSSR